MRFSTSFVAAAGLLSTASAAIKGFNYGSNFNNNQAKTLTDFEYEFNAAKNLPGTNGWSSARLYTTIQHGTQSTVIEAIQAAINTQTTLLLGLWASAGQTAFDNEIIALKAAIAQHGTAFTDLVEGISVGSEDLYRITPTGRANSNDPGAEPQQLLSYVQQTRNALRGTPLDGKPVGHVDTWTVYVNATNNDFIASLDFLGMDAYPYFQTAMANGIGSSSQLFFDAYHQTVAAAQGKPVWVTETGWPVSGKTLNQAVPGAADARIFWEDVTCQLIADNVNLYYYALQDVQFGDPSPSFGIKPAGDLQSVAPLFDLSCPNNARPSSSLSSTVLRRSSSVGTSTSNLMSTTSISTSASTFLSSTVIVSSSLGLIPIPTGIPTGLRGIFEAPSLIVTFEKANPSNVISDRFIAQLSPNLSTVFAFDVGPEFQGKTCNLMFYMPPPFPIPDRAPVSLRSPGGISVSRLSNGPTTTDIIVDSAVPIGVAPSIEFANQYNIGSMPCGAGQRAIFQVDSIGGLGLNFFQMISPATGLFIVPA